ncbi:MAG: peptidoglycan-binding protein [Desulfotomaculaceae bacterium]|nr:peptidoglycan-binding protein [Desulfotomaculaceae bacterium]
MKYSRLGAISITFVVLYFALISTSEALQNLACPLNPEQGRILFLKEPNISGRDVAELQERLKALGYYGGAINSVYDDETSQAVASAQENLDLHPDGTVDQITLQALVAATDQKLFKSRMPAVPEKVSVIIDMDRLSLTIFDGTEPVRQYPVAMGKYETPTPVGNWEIVSKSMNPADAMGTRWLGLNIPYGNYGIHGTNAPGSIGSFASHGCIRMHNVNVEEIFPSVTVGTAVTIIGTPFGAPGTPPSILRLGSKGPDVLEVQRSLKRLGYLKWNPDGFWGEGTEKAVKKFRQDNDLKGMIVVDEEVFKLLGF